jgi:hypothetical protein
MYIFCRGARERDKLRAHTTHTQSHSPPHTVLHTCLTYALSHSTLHKCTRNSQIEWDVTSLTSLCRDLR